MDTAGGPRASILDGVGSWASGFSDEALSELARCACAKRSVHRRTVLTTEDVRLEHLYLLVDGWALVRRHLPDGHQQILDIRLPGDLVALAEAWLGAPAPDVTMLTDGGVTPIRCHELIAAARLSPELCKGVADVLAESQMVADERRAKLIHHSAYEKVVALLWSIRTRLRDRGRTNGASFPFPVTQAIMADALGLSVVHVNRSLRQLTRDGVLDKRSDHVVVLDEAAFARLADGI